jgi:H+/Cl- antiporter ClcA
MQKAPLHEIKRLDSTKLIFILKGAIIGVLAGFVVSVFRLAIEKLLGVTMLAYHYFNERPLFLIPWVFFSILIALILGLLIKSDPNIKGSGIPQVEGQLQGEISQNWISVLWKKFVGGILAAGLGLFLGREGPSIQLGSAVAQGVSERFHSTKSEEKIFISSGAAAGLAAAFNAPIAGLLFVVEEVHHTFSPLVWLTSLTSAVAANFVSIYFFGLTPVLFVGNVPYLPLKYYGWLILLGVLLGVLGFAYQKVLLLMPKIYSKTKLDSHLYPLIPFLLVIPIGLTLPHVLGGGNQVVIQVANHPQTALLLLGLFILRFVFSMVSYGSTLPGGIFLPILTLGAVFGAFYGMVLTQATGMDVQYVKDFAVLAMAGYFTAIGKAPLTAIILVTEMVGNITHLMPLGVISLVAYVVNDVLGGNPIYESLLIRLLNKKIPTISGHKTVIEYAVTAESALDGLMVRDFLWPKDMLLVSIRRGNSELISHGDTIMKMGDSLLIFTDERLERAIIKEIDAKSQKMLK